MEAERRLALLNEAFAGEASSGIKCGFSKMSVTFEKKTMALFVLSEKSALLVLSLWQHCEHDRFCQCRSTILVIPNI